MNIFMRIIDFYVDAKNAYLKMEKEVSFYIQIDDQEIEIPAKIDNEVYIVKLDDLVKIVQQVGRFPIGVKVNGEFERLHFKELLRARVSGRYFATRWAKKKLYITTEGYLNFAHFYKKELFISSQKTANVYAGKAKLYVKESRIFLELSLVGKVKGSVKAVNIVDFDAQKRYVVQYTLSSQALKVDLTGVPQMGLGRYQVVIDSQTSQKIESQMVKMIEGGSVNTEEPLKDDDSIKINGSNENDKSANVKFSWFLVVENKSFILCSTREEISSETEEIAVRSVGNAFENYIELDVNLDSVGITGVRTRYKRLDKNIELDYNYDNQKLRIDFSELNGFIDGDFWIYVRDKMGNYYQLCYEIQPIPSFFKQDRYFFIHGTENSARYAYFSIDGYLRYIIKPVSSYQEMSDKTIQFNNLCFLNNYFQIELNETVPVEKLILGENELLEFYQNNRILFICMPDQESVVTTEYLSILSRNQLYKLGAVNLTSDASAHYGLSLFTGWRERLAMKPLRIEYYVAVGKIPERLEVEIPNIRSKHLELIVNSGIEIERVIAINRKILNVKELEFKQKGQVLVIQPKNFEPCSINIAVSYIFDIVFVTNDGLALALVKNHKQLTGKCKKQPWQISERNREMLYQIYINASGNLSVTVKDNYYAENWEKFSVKDNLILYETQDGKRIADSGYAIFKYLVDHPQFKDFEHIWVINDEKSNAPTALEEKYRNACKFVVRRTRTYKKALLEAKYLIISHTLEDYFAKKPDQVYIHTWHGTAIKALGFDIVGEAANSRNVIRNLMMSDYIISPNAHMSKVFADSYKLRGIYQGIILEGGYPRNDIIATMDENIIAQKLHYFSIKFDLKKPTILYAPTWRGTNVGKPMNQIPELKELVAFLQKNYEDTHNILLKVHPFAYELAKEDIDLQTLLVPDYIDTNEILSIVDIMIADFSSIFFDYLLTDKPIVFYMPDKDSYEKNRGVYLDFNDLPGPQVVKYGQLEKEINRIIAGKKNKYLNNYIAMKNEYLAYDDGRTTERYVQRIFKNEKSDKIKEIIVNSDKRKLLLYIGGMLSNGITSSALNLLDNLDYDKYDVTIMMYLQKSKENLNNIEKINKRTRIMFAFGAQLYASEEILKDDNLIRSGFSKESWESMIAGYRRNMSNRVLPNMSFDVAIEFSGYGSASVRNLLSLKANKQVIYLHSEMSKDAKRLTNDKFTLIDNFNTIFTLYPFASKLVSVSKSLMEENTKQLSHIVKAKQMTFARNTINHEYILKQAKEKINLSNLKSIDGNPVVPVNTSNGLNFVTSGRLSSEKNYIALIKAFAKFEKDYPGARLFILGKGPLQADINSAIESVEMDGKIYMLGHLDNPFAFINKMDYYVLASVHEGQPMVLLEALILRKKIMASNIKPNIGVLGDSVYGLIAGGTTPDALYEGLKNLMRQSGFKRFDYIKYNQEAIKDFNRLVGE